MDRHLWDRVGVPRDRHLGASGPLAWRARRRLTAASVSYRLAAFFFRSAQDFFIRSETARLCAAVILRRFRPLAFAALAALAGVLPLPVNAVIAASIRPTSASSVAFWLLSFATMASIKRPLSQVLSISAVLVAPCQSVVTTSSMHTRLCDHLHELVTPRPVLPFSERNAEQRLQRVLPSARMCQTHGAEVVPTLSCHGAPRFSISIWRPGTAEMSPPVLQ